MNDNIDVSGGAEPKLIVATRDEDEDVADAVIMM